MKYFDKLLERCTDDEISGQIKALAIGLPLGSLIIIVVLE